MLLYVITLTIIAAGEFRIRGKVRKRHATNRRYREILSPCNFNETIVEDEVLLMDTIARSKYIFTAKVLNVKKVKSYERPHGKRSNLYKVYMRRVLKGEIDELGKVIGIESSAAENLSGATLMVERPRARESCAPSPRARLSAIFLSDGLSLARHGAVSRLRLLTDPVPLTLFHLDRINAAVKGNMCF